MSDELLEVYKAETTRQLELYPDRPLGRIMRKVEQRIDTDARRVAELEGEVERLAKVLKSIPTLDKTPEYEYGEPDRNGNKPGSGKRWKTPAESSRDALRLLKEATDGK